MEIEKQIFKIKRIGQGHILDKMKWLEFADEIDVLLKMIENANKNKLKRAAQSLRNFSNSVKEINPPYERK